MKDFAVSILKSKLLVCAILTAFFGLLAVDGLRSNYSTMTKLREDVVVADSSGTDVEVTLQKLRSHVYSHMNTDLSTGDHPIKPPIQLKSQYERLLSAEQARIKVANETVQATAQTTCSQQFSGGGFNPNQVDCVQKYVSANAAKEKLIADELYKFDFISPTWSPDKAGWSLVFAFIFGLAAVLMVIWKLIKRQMEPPLY